MAITQVNAAGAFSTALNPTLTFTTRGAVGDFLLVLAALRSGNMPGSVTDSLSTPITMFQCSDSPSGQLSLCGFEGYMTAAGKDVITVPTDAPAAVGAIELSGVRTGALGGIGHTGGVYGSSGSALDAANAIMLSATAQNAGDLLLAVICAFGSCTFTQNQPGWTQLFQLPSGNSVSMQVLSQTPATAGVVTVDWSMTATLPTVAALLPIPHA